MRIGILTQWFAPEPGPAALPAMLANSLAIRGHDVQVVTGFPNYPTGRIPEGYRQSVRLDEVWNRVAVRRVALYPNHGHSSIGRVFNYGSFALSATASGLNALKGIDVLWVNYSPVTIALPMFAHVWRRGTPVVVHILDLWPDTMFASGFAGDAFSSRLTHRLVSAWCDGIYRRARSVAFISPSVGEVLQQRGVPPQKLHYAPMWADETLFWPRETQERSRWGLGGDTIALVYAGTLGVAQDLATLVRACAEIRDLDFKCLIAGSGTDGDRLRNLAEQSGATNVTFLGRLDSEEVAALTAASDLQYIGLNDHPLASVTMPSKVQATLASGRTIIGSLVGDAAAVVRAAGGVSVPPGDVGALSYALRMATDRGRRGLAAAGKQARQFYEREFTMDTGVARIERILLEAADG